MSEKKNVGATQFIQNFSRNCSARPLETHYYVVAEILLKDILFATQYTVNQDDKKKKKKKKKSSLRGRRLSSLR